MITVHSTSTDPRTVEEIVGGHSAFDQVLAEEQRDLALERKAAVAGAGIVTGVLLGGLSWGVFIAGFVWFITR
jgi:hypothetical protein